MYRFGHAALALLLVTILPSSSFAQAARGPKADVAASYSFLHDQDASDTFGVGWVSFPTGWVAAVAGNFAKGAALVGEVGANYRSVDVGGGASLKVSVYTYQGGLRFRAEGRARPFGQVLFGVGHAAAGLLGISSSLNALSVQPGGGVDVMVSKTVGVRAQGDYRYMRRTKDNVKYVAKEFRVAFGVVIDIG